MQFLKGILRTKESTLKFNIHYRNKIPEIKQMVTIKDGKYKKFTELIQEVQELTKRFPEREKRKKREGNYLRFFSDLKDEISRWGGQSKCRARRGK